MGPAAKRLSGKTVDLVVSHVLSPSVKFDSEVAYSCATVRRVHCFPLGVHHQGIVQCLRMRSGHFYRSLEMPICVRG